MRGVSHKVKYVQRKVHDKLSALDNKERLEGRKEGGREGTEGRKGGGIGEVEEGGHVKVDEDTRTPSWNQETPLLP